MADSPLNLLPSDRLAALRIIDANFNRASEGLRVVEEYCRFVLEDWHLTGYAKYLRHNLLEAIAPLPTGQFTEARDSEHDVGTDLANFHTISRYSLDHIVRANLKRVEQALRAMEEYAKLLDPAVASRLETLRYRSYTLEKACLATADSLQRLADAHLYVLIDGGSSESALAERVSELITADVHLIQLRDKQLDDRTLLARARLLRRIIDERRLANSEPRTLNREPSVPLFILNDRPDLAVLARADGVHLGQDELSVHDARQIVGPAMLIGVSTHTIEQARQAVQGGASYLGCGPVFPSGTKQFEHFPGLAFLRQVAAEIALPAFAIGGITPDNLPQVLATGFTRVAASGAIADSSDVAAAVSSFAKLLWPGPRPEL